MNLKLGELIAVLTELQTLAGEEADTNVDHCSLVATAVVEREYLAGIYYTSRTEEKRRREYRIRIDSYPPVDPAAIKEGV